MKVSTDFSNKIFPAQWTSRIDSKPGLATGNVEVMLRITLENDDLIGLLKLFKANSTRVLTVFYRNDACGFVKSGVFLFEW